MSEYERGDVFTTPSGPIEVKAVGRYGDYLTVTDPTVNHPQDARAGRWKLEVSLLEDDLEDGTIERATLEVV